MKIAFLVHDYHRKGGHSRYVVELATRFQHEHEVHVFANTWDSLGSENVYFHKVPALTNREILKVLTFIIPGTQMIAKGTYDIVHAQGLCGLRHDITTSHCVQASWLKGLESRGIKTGWSGLFWKWLVVPLERRAFDHIHSKRVIAISQRVRRDLQKEYKCKSNIDLVYHGIDLKKFHPENKTRWRGKIRDSLGINPDDFASIFVGNLQKGACAAIEAIAMVPDAKLILVSGSNNQREIKLAQKLGIQKQLFWVSPTNHIERYFAAADCFLFPTFYDTYGMVISEAMASGLPVITSKEAGASDLILHGDSGFLLEDAWDSEAMAANLILLKSQPDISSRMASAARRAMEPFTWEKCAIETMACYQRVLEERKARDQGKF